LYRRTGQQARETAEIRRRDDRSSQFLDSVLLWQLQFIDSFALQQADPGEKLRREYKSHSNQIMCLERYSLTASQSEYVATKTFIVLAGNWETAAISEGINQ
jgi:hypothetical protein